MSGRYAQRANLGVEKRALYPKATDPTDETDRLVARSGFDEHSVAPGYRADAGIVASNHAGDTVSRFIGPDEAQRRQGIVVAVEVCDVGGHIGSDLVQAHRH